MSDSERNADPASIMLEASGSGSRPETALAQALEGVLGKMIAAGVAPVHITAMEWSGPEPAALHPSRAEIDREWRLVFVGFRIPPTITRAADERVHVRVTARRPSGPPPSAPVYRDYGVAELARQMSPRNQVPDMGALFRQWSLDGQEARAAYSALDLAYGPGRGETLDLYRKPGLVRAPVWVFIHGGYWQASTKEQHAQFCRGMVEAGFAVANLEYPLAPEAPLEAIVGHVRNALRFLVQESGRLDIDADRIHVAGHSAGGYLAAMCACDPQMPPVRSAHLLSGIFDLESLRPIPFGPILGISIAEFAARLSPINLRPRAGARIGVAVGALESDEFRRQSAEIARLWNASPSLVVEGAHHFNLLDGLNSGALLDQQLRLAG